VPPPERPKRPVRLRRAAAVLLLAALVPTALPAGSPTAGASSVYLCTGYKGCSQAGMTDHGYGAANKTMYWRMYAGHNCTNYVAYRLIQAGMSTERPWDGTGMAYNWGRAMKSITDKVPAVGAVAWWESGASGASSSGHVAIVEKVVSDTEIIVSEDVWGGDFSWRRIVKDGTGWPTGFIHFVDKSVANTVAPRVTGTPQVGATLRAAKGRWKPAPTYSYQWLADQRPIGGATAQTFSPGPDHVGAAISVRVTASKDRFTPGVIETPATAPVAKGELVSTAPPTVTGDGEVDAVLTAAPGTWSTTPDSTRFRWRSNGTVIAGAAASRLTLTRSMVGTTITAEEVASRAGFVRATAVAPQAVGPVVQGTIELVTPFAASGRNHHGAALSLARGTTSPSDVTVTYTWLRDGVVVPGAVGASYALTDADVGRAIGARITMSKPRYAPLQRTYEFGRTTTPAAVDVRTVGRKQRAVVTVRVTAPGAVPSGPVTVRLGGVETSATLVDGSARVVVRGLRAGERTVRVRYAGGDVVKGARGSAPVTVLPAGRRS
jgi:surface antigen